MFGIPFANALPHNHDNLIIRAAQLLARAAKIKPRARIHLKIILPVAAGIGGGSADAVEAIEIRDDLLENRSGSDGEE